MSDYIPEEIIQKILLKLPVKSLIRCTAVCKSWRSLIESSTFAQNHLSHTIQFNHQNDVHLLLLQKGQRGAVYSLQWDNPTFGEHHINVAKPFVDNNCASVDSGCFPRVIGTYNGLVCLAYNNTSYPIIVCNPSIRKYVVLPETKLSAALMMWHRLEFGYDSQNDDYKVLRIRSGSHQSDDFEVDVWSLSRGSWKTLKAKLKNSSPRGNTTTLVNGVLHRVHCRKESIDHFILCFDMVNELFGEIIIPQDLRKKVCSIIRYGESIGLLDVRNSGFRLWFMEEYGVVESWTTKFVVSLQGVRVDLTLYAFTSSKVVLLRETTRDGSKLLSVDLKSKTVERLFEIDGCKAFDSFVESLILVGQANACSYKDKQE